MPPLKVLLSIPPPISDSCTCNSTLKFCGSKAESDAGANIQDSIVGKFYTLCDFALGSRLLTCQLLMILVDHESRNSELAETSHGLNLFGEDKYNRNEKLKETGSPPRKDEDGEGSEDMLEVLETALSTISSNAAKENKGKSIASSQDLSATKEASFADETPNAVAPHAQDHITHESRMTPHNEVGNLTAPINTAVEHQNEAEEATLVENLLLAAPEGAFPGKEPYVEQMKKLWPDDAFSTGETISKEDLTEEGIFSTEATLGASQGDQVIDDLHHAKDRNYKENSPTKDLDFPYVSLPTSNVGSMHGIPAEDSGLLTLPSRSGSGGTHRGISSHPLPSPAPSSTTPSAIEAAAPEVPDKAGHTIALQIINGKKILRSVIFTKACTRTAILNEARAYCMDGGQRDQYFESPSAEGLGLTLVSLKINGYDMDLSTYNAEDLSFLVGAVEKTGIPSFTLRLSGI